MFHYFESIQDQQGNALPGWQVELVSVSDGETVIDIFADENSTPIETESGITNRAVSDELGNLSLFVDDGTYSLRFFDAAGVFQRTIRFVPMFANIDPSGTSDIPQSQVINLVEDLGAKASTTALNDGLAAKVATATLAASGGAGGVGFVQAGTGATTRTVASKIQEIISVKDFGATGDGATDDTAAISSAITHAASLAGNHPVAVYFPTGDYLYTSITITSSRVWLTGSARLIKTTTTGNGITFDGTAVELVQPGIVGLTFGAQTENTSGYAVRFFKCIQPVFTATIKPFPAAVFNGAVFDECTAIKIPPLVQIEDCVNDGITFRDCVDVYWELGRSDANGRYGVLADNVSGFYPSAVTAFNNGVNAWRFQSTFTPNRADANGFVFGASCIGDTSGGDNWYFDQLSNSVFSGCWGSTQSGTAVDTNGFYLTGCFELEFNGCIALTNNACGLRAGGTASENIFINGGRYNDNGQESGSALRAGVSLGTTDQVVIDGARMSDRQGTKTQQYGLQLDATLAQLSVDNCDMRGNAAGPYLFAATPTLFQQSNNRTGETASYASATDVTTSPFIDAFEITGTTDVLNIAPRWEGRQITVWMDDTASFVGPGFGGAFRLPAATLTPDNHGTASFVWNGTNWLLTASSVNGGS